MPFVVYILIVLAAYLLGSIPTGFLMAKAKGIDIRAVGSGNIGATNAMRVLGKPVGIAVLLLDVLKGYAAVTFLAPMICDGYLHWIKQHTPFLVKYFRDQPDAVQIHMFILAGIFAVLGHNYTCWLKFKGGKGIATTTGVYLALAPWAVLIALGVFLLAVLVTRYVSVGSISGAVALVAAVWILPPHNVFLGIVTTALGALAIYKHKSNIQRLRAGTENRLGKKSEAK